jgi:hypothetical protein
MQREDIELMKFVLTTWKCVIEVSNDLLKNKLNHKVERGSLAFDGA